MYLFNRYLLTAMRISLCSLLLIEALILIASGIWLGNIAITLSVK